MSEYEIGYQFIGGLGGLVLASFFYFLGGRAHKWLRRYLGSFVLAVTVNTLFVLQGAWSPWYLAIWPLLIGGFSLGYGGDDVGQKILRRSIYFLGVVSSGLLCAYIGGGNAYILFGVHAGLGLFSILLGVKNPVLAAVEEPMICVILNLCLIGYPFIS